MIAGTENNLGEEQAQRLESVYEQLTTLLRQHSLTQRLRTAPGENEWSAMQILGHMVEMIPYWLDHCQVMIAATTEPPKFGRLLDAPERLAGVERAATENLGELLRLLDGEIQSAAHIIRQMTSAERKQWGVHLRLGEMTVADVVEVFVVAHAEDHLAQIRAALEA